VNHQNYAILVLLAVMTK
jgi:hypothetical protein